MLELRKFENFMRIKKWMVIRKITELTPQSMIGYELHKIIE